MGLKLEKVLDKNINNRLLQEAIKTGDIFKDYVPAIVFAEPQPNKPTSPISTEYPCKFVTL